MVAVATGEAGVATGEGSQATAEAQAAVEEAEEAETATSVGSQATGLLLAPIADAVALCNVHLMTLSCAMEQLT